MRKKFLFFLLSMPLIEARAQDNESEPKETFTAGAYLDLCYNYNFNEPSDGNNAYFVSYNRHNEINVNLGYAALNYKTPHFKSRLALGAGTYMNANYAAEPGTLKNIAEASVAVRLSKKRNYWMEAGVLISPYTNESALSKDQPMYTRTGASQNLHHCPARHLKMGAIDPLSALLPLCPPFETGTGNV